MPQYFTDTALYLLLLYLLLLFVCLVFRLVYLYCFSVLSVFCDGFIIGNGDAEPACKLTPSELNRTE